MVASKVFVFKLTFLAFKSITALALASGEVGNKTTIVLLLPEFLTRQTVALATIKLNSALSPPPTIPPEKINLLPEGTVKVARVEVALGLITALPKTETIDLV